MAIVVIKVILRLSTKLKWREFYKLNGNNKINMNKITII